MANQKYTRNNIIDTNAEQSVNHWFDNQNDTYSSESSKRRSRKPCKQMWQQIARNARADAIESKAKQIHNMHRQRHACQLDQQLDAQLNEIVNNHNLNYDEVKSNVCAKAPIWNPEGLHWNNDTTNHAKLPQQYFPNNSPSTNGTISRLSSHTANMSNQSTASICEILNVFNVERTDWKKIMLQYPAACATHMNDTYHIVLDSGASMCITNNKSDFVGPIKPIQNAKVDGINCHL